MAADANSPLHWSGHSARLLILESSKLGNLHTRIEEFSNATGADISITSVSIKSWQSEVFADAGRNGPRAFDGYSTKGNWIPALVEDGGLSEIDINNIFDEIQWTDIVSVVRESICLYDRKVYAIPVDADYIVSAARDDLLSIDQTLDTWEEWVEFAEEQHGRDLNGDNEPDFGACLAKGDGQVHFSVFGPLWAIVAPYLQKQGTEFGAFFDSATFEPLWSQDNKPFVKALRLYKRLVNVTMEGEVTAIDAKGLFESGRCATWLSLPGFVFGVQDTGGIKSNLTTATMKRYASPGVKCESHEECPLAAEVTSSSLKKTRLINRAPFFSTSGAGLSISSSASADTQQLLMHLYAYIAAPAQSNYDVMLRISFSDPFRNSQLNELAVDRLIELNGWNRSDAESYTEIAYETLNDENGVLDLRVPGINDYQNSAQEMIFPYVYGDNNSITASDTADAIAKTWDAIPVTVFPDSSQEAAVGKMQDIYRAQLGLPPIVKDVSYSGQTSSNASTLVPAIVIPIAVVSAVCAYLFVEWRKKNSDSIWAVKRTELKFDEPPVVVGRGTFGLVLLGEYRGTEVAVKRVIPPRMKANPRRSNESENGSQSSGSDTLKRVLILGDGDKEEINQRRTSNFDFNDKNDPEAGMTNTMTSSGSNSVKFTASGSGGTYFDSNGSAVPDSYRTSMVAKFRRQNNTHEKLKSDFVVEMRQLSKLRHPCITTVMGAVIDPLEEPMLVMEYMERGSLYDLLHNESVALDGTLLLPILKDVAQGGRFLHAAVPQVIHGDIKAQNVLVDSKFRAKLTDFGLSQKKAMGLATGTPLWMAPELLRRETSNTAASDVYSFGIVLYEVYSREDPYAGEDLEQVIKDVCNVSINRRPAVPFSMPPKVSEIMEECMKSNPKERPTFEKMDLLFKSLNSDLVEPAERKMMRRGSLNRKMSNLILNCFPPHIAEALQNGRKVEQESHECVTIFFSDIVGFTTISQSITPQKVCEMLDRLYQKFDDLSLKHDIFKIETIGDAYMAITNLVKDQSTDHVKRAAAFSKDAIKASSETLIDEEDPEKGYVQIRVGFHSGPVIADVIGSRLPKYGVFGDTVNTASRMESNSETGRIHCSEASANLLMVQDHDIRIVSRGSIKIKGKGEMKTFWVGDEVKKKKINETN